MKLFLFTFAALSAFSLSQASASILPYVGQRAHDIAADCAEIEYYGQEHLLPKHYSNNKCTSSGFDGYFDDLSKYYMAYNQDSRGYEIDPFIQSVHILVTDIKRDADVPTSTFCSSEMCYRAFVFINGDSKSGLHVATWATSPGTNTYADGTGDYTPVSATHVNPTTGRPEPNQTAQGYFQVQLDREMGLYDNHSGAGVQTGKIDGLYVLDHYVNSDNEDMAWPVFFHYGTGFHFSPNVTGDAASHKCARLKYIESKKVNFLARHVLRNFTVETRFTERDKLDGRVLTQFDLAASGLERINNLRQQAEFGATKEIRDAAQSQLDFDSLSSGGLY